MNKILAGCLICTYILFSPLSSIGQMKKMKADLKISLSAEESSNEGKLPVLMKITVENVSSRAVELVQTTELLDYRFTVIDKDNHPVQLTSTGQRVQENQGQLSRIFITLMPGERREYKIAISSLYAMNRPGLYTISATRSIYNKNSKKTALISSNKIQARIMTDSSWSIEP
jgi:hypothetical protein